MVKLKSSRRNVTNVIKSWLNVMGYKFHRRWRAYSILITTLSVSFRRVWITEFDLWPDLYIHDMNNTTQIPHGGRIRASFHSPETPLFACEVRVVRSFIPFHFLINTELQWSVCTSLKELQKKGDIYKRDIQSHNSK